MKSKLCYCCRESVAILERVEDGHLLCLDCKAVYEEALCHRWDQIAAVSKALKKERRHV